MTLFGLDDPNRRAIFVETPPDVDLSQHPFYYMAQYEHAQRLIAVPYDELLQLADQRGPIDRPIFIYSIGRCGSTLMSNVFSQVDGTLSLSEPDVYSNLTWLRESDRTRDAELTALTRACTRLLCKPSPQNTQPNMYVIKHRSWAIRIADLQYAATPDAQNLFLYRNAETWLASLSRMVQGASSTSGPDRTMELFRPVMMHFHPEIMAFVQTLDGRAPTNSEIMTVMWAGLIEQYERCQQIMPFLAVRYEDLNMHREQVIRAAFEYCGVSTSELSAALTAFASDSQAGTPLARENAGQGNQRGLDPAVLTELWAVLATSAPIHTPDHIVPGTLKL
jgi:hypothetical protein